MSHLNANHPAVGLLDCARGSNGKAFRTTGEPGAPERSSDMCGWCGMDRAWHNLEVGDYTGVQPRPQPWEDRLNEAFPDRSRRVIVPGPSSVDRTPAGGTRVIE